MDPVMGWLESPGNPWFTPQRPGPPACGQSLPGWTVLRAKSKVTVMGESGGKPGFWNQSHWNLGGKNPEPEW